MKNRNIGINQWMELHMSFDEKDSTVNYNRAFAIGITLNIVFVVVEAVYGFRADSLALVADAGHNLSDVLSLFLAWGASLISKRKPSTRRTYGFRRATILASLLSSIMLLVALGMIAWEAIGRFIEPVPVEGMTMIIVAGIGVIINSVTAMLFSKGHKHDLNIKGAYLHMAADAGVSLGVVIAGLAIIATGWEWLDPTISLTIVAIILIGTLKLLHESANLSLDAVPPGINSVKVRQYLQDLPGVSEVHDLHIWATSTTENALTVHLTMPQSIGDDTFLCNVSNSLYEKFNIDHPTIQIERGDTDYACRQSARKDRGPEGPALT